ncbi:hypothetical protein CF65_01472 [Aggregatibacter actinomycetemcomitans HK1651]|nr:hypothetical protein CF65_01472 [Aggregatibacter actinomycetemcomitans HK1651]
MFGEIQFGHFLSRLFFISVLVSRGRLKSAVGFGRVSRAFMPDLLFRHGYLPIHQHGQQEIA